MPLVTAAVCEMPTPSMNPGLDARLRGGIWDANLGKSGTDTVTLNNVVPASFAADILCSQRRAWICRKIRKTPECNDRLPGTQIFQSEVRRKHRILIDMRYVGYETQARLKDETSCQCVRRTRKDVVAAEFAQPSQIPVSPPSRPESCSNSMLVSRPKKNAMHTTTPLVKQPCGCMHRALLR